jgi:hypothetical protein
MAYPFAVVIHVSPLSAGVISIFSSFEDSPKKRCIHSILGEPIASLAHMKKLLANRKLIAALSKMEIDNKE